MAEFNNINSIKNETMSFESTNNPCPCESGFEYPYCCGASDRNDINVVGKIQDDGAIEGDLPEGLKQSIVSIKRTPDLYPVKLDWLKNQAQLVKMSPYWYSECVFLDLNRILGTCAIEASSQWLFDATEEMPVQVSPIIFHTAFCGSTLMSKALEVIFDCLPIREPDALSNLLVYMHSQAPEAQKQLWFQRVLALLGRRYEAKQPAVIKTNDYSNGLIIDVLARRPDIPVLFMYTPLTDFFAACVKADSRKKWVCDRCKAIENKVSEKIPEFQHASIDENSIGQMAAVYWAYNIALFCDASEKHSDKLRSLNFTDMLKNPLETVTACAQWFGLTQQSGVKPIDEIRWLLGVYSKDASYEYSPEKRRDDMQKVLNENAVELAVAEATAKQLLGDRYPEAGLALGLLN